MTQVFYMGSSEGLPIVLNMCQPLLQSSILRPVDPLPWQSVLVKVVKYKFIPKYMWPS
jgi:hypothetical protein